MPRTPAVLLLTLAACADSGTAPVPEPGTALPTLSLEGGSSHWAGAPFTVRMRGPGARPLDARLLLADHLEVSLVYRDDSTLVGTFPTTARGIEHRPRVVYQGADTLLDPITTYGPTAHATSTWDFPAGYLFSPPYPVGTGRVLIAATDWYATFLPWNEFNGEGNGMAVPEHPVPQQLVSPGPTPDPDVWLFRSAADAPLERWHLRPGPRRLEVLPWISAAASRSVASLGDGRLLAFGSSSGQVLRREGAGWVAERTLFLADVTRVRLSPRGDRAALTGARGTVTGSDPNGSNTIPVLRVPEGEPAFTLDAAMVVAADFSPDGSLLATAEGSTVPLVQGVTIRDAGDGTILRTLPGDAGPVRGVAFDPARPILYLLVLTPPGPHFELQAWSTTTWTRLGRMQGRCHHGCVHQVQIVADAGNTVFTLEQHPMPGRDELVTYRFTVPYP